MFPSNIIKEILHYMMNDQFSVFLFKVLQNIPLDENELLHPFKLTHPQNYQLQVPTPIQHIDRCASTAVLWGGVFEAA